jgi:hypothetical protein
MCEIGVITYKAVAGDNLEEIIAMMVEIVNQYRVEAKFEFNGVEITIPRPLDIKTQKINIFNEWNRKMREGFSR